MAHSPPQLPLMSLCVKCRYPLDGLLILDAPPSSLAPSACPECGTSFYPATITLPLKCVIARNLSWMLRFMAIFVLLAIFLPLARFVFLPPAFIVLIAVLILVPVFFLTRKLTSTNSVMLCFSPTGVSLFQFGTHSSEIPYSYLAPLQLSRIVTLTRRPTDLWRCRVYFRDRPKFRRFGAPPSTTPRKTPPTTPQPLPPTPYEPPAIFKPLVSLFNPPTPFARGTVHLTADQAALVLDAVNQRIQHASSRDDLAITDKPSDA